MFEKYRSLLILFIIFLIAGVLRFYHIDQVPVSLYWDEAAQGYNAYSIAQTGKDEYGSVMPLLFRSFDDYKLPAYTYLTAFFVKVFGLSEFSVRAGSAVLGTLTIIALYLFVKEFGAFSKKHVHEKHDWFSFLNPEVLALLSAGILAITPWHITFSRTGFEANAGLFFIVLGAWLFLKGLRYHWYFFTAIISFAISWYFYRSIPAFVALLVIGLVTIFWKHLRVLGNRTIITGVVLGVILILPIIVALLSPGGAVRASQVSIFSTDTDDYKQYVALVQQIPGGSLTKLLYNRKLFYIEDFFTNYVSYFSPAFLFINGDGNARHGTVGTGLLYLWMLPFWFVGLIYSVRLPTVMRNTMWLWLLLAPIPAAIAIPSPHALRSLNAVPIEVVFIALGIYGVYQLLRRYYRYVYIAAIVCLTIFFLGKYLLSYYTVNAKVSSSQWADGYKQLVQAVDARQNNYQAVIISGHYWEPYIYFLLYNHIDPASYQQSGSSTHFGKYYFGGTSWDMAKNHQEFDSSINLASIAHTTSALVALSPSEYDAQKSHVRKLTEIRNHNGDLVFIVADLL